MTVFNDQAALRLASSALEEVRQTSPHAVAGLSKEEVNDRFQRVLSRLPMYQFATKEDLHIYVTLSFLIGTEFDRFPGFNEFPKIGEALRPYEFVLLLTSEESETWEDAAQFDVIERYSKPTSSNNESVAETIEMVPLSDEHSRSYHACALHPDVWRLGRMRPMLHLSEVQEFIWDLTERNQFAYAAVGVNSQFLGAIIGERLPDHIEIQYWVPRHLWGLGIGRRMLVF